MIKSKRKVEISWNIWATKRPLDSAQRVGLEIFGDIVGEALAIFFLLFGSLSRM